MYTPVLVPDNKYCLILFDSVYAYIGSAREATDLTDNGIVFVSRPSNSLHVACSLDVVAPAKGVRILAVASRRTA